MTMRLLGWLTPLLAPWALMACFGGDDAEEPAQEFPAVPFRAGEVSDWEAELTWADGSVQSYGYRMAVTHFTQPGIAFVVTTRSSDGRPTAYRELDEQANLVSYAQVSYDQDGNDYPSNCSFQPVVAFYRFPLSVGQAWSAPWATSHCIDANEGGGHVEVEVLAYEAVDVPAGHFASLRLHTTLVEEAEGAGGLGRTESDCWWAVELGRLVRCETTTFDFTTGAVSSRTSERLMHHEARRLAGLVSPR
jgi:hypothetical protein